VLGGLALLPTLPAPAYGRAPFPLKLEVETGQKSPAKSRPSPSGAVLVLNSMGEARRQQLADSLAKLAAAVDRRKNPFFVALDDSEERKPVEDLIRQAAPTFTAAAALCAGRWQSAEGDVRIRPVNRCAAHTRCVSLDEAPGQDEGERRARFLAWPLGYAVILSVASPILADDVADALRAPGSTHIGLVLTGTELHRLRKSPALRQLLEHARHVIKTAPAKRPPFLDLLAKIANAATARDELPWFNLPRDSILIVPRLGALATSDAFVADLRARLQAQSVEVEWLASPR
jgi:hypothetical protein